MINTSQKKIPKHQNFTGTLIYHPKQCGSVPGNVSPLGPRADPPVSGPSHSSGSDPFAFNKYFWLAFFVDCLTGENGMRCPQWHLKLLECLSHCELINWHSVYTSVFLGPVNVSLLLKLGSIFR